MGHNRHPAKATAWILGLPLAALALSRLGRLEWMSIEWADFWGWLARTDLEVALAALLRVAGLVMVGWVVLSTLVYVVARLAGAGPDRIDWLSTGPLRRLDDALIAGSMMFNAMTPAGALVDDGTPPPSTEQLMAVDPSYVPVPAGPSTRPPLTGETIREDEPAPSENGQDGPRAVTVTKGDSLWRLAENCLSEVLGRDPTDGETAPYWARVVAHNRPTIRSGDPDLIFPGEEIALPPVAEA